MATQLKGPTPPPDTIEYLNNVSSQIRRVFNQLIAQLIAKKEALLRKVSQIQEEYQKKEAARMEEYQNRVKQESNESDTPLDVPSKLPHISFQHHGFKRLQTMIKKFAEVTTCQVPVYSEKGVCFLAIGEEGNNVGEFKHPRAIAIDEENKHLFIADCGNARIQIISFEGDFIAQFGQGVLKWPWGIGVIRDQIFVTDIQLHVILNFDRNTLQLISEVSSYGEAEGQLKSPYGLSVDMNGDLYVADSLNNRVSVFTELLDFVTCIGKGHLKTPQDVKLTPTSVVVLDSSKKCVQFFSKNGDFLSSCISQGESCQVWNPFFFCVDHDQNLIVSDYNHHMIKVYSSSKGEFVRAIGSKGLEKGEFRSPYGIALSSSSGVIFVVSENFKCALQAF